MARARVVVTGASGYIVRRMWQELNERYDIVALDVRDTAATGERIAGVEICDLHNADRDSYRHHFEGADAVIHCGYIAAPGETGSNADITTNTDEQFDAEHKNLRMAYNVYRTSLEVGVRRVVVASSNHAADFYERLIWADRLQHATPEMLPLSDNFYGWAKASYELLGFTFATGQVEGRQLEVVQLRIGGPRDDADLPEMKAGQLKEMHRGLGAYFSQRDQVQLFVKSIEANDIRDANGVPFQVFFGVSGNSHNFWCIANARRVIGYVPEDNSQVSFAEQIAELAVAARES